VLDADFAPQWAKQQGIEASSLEQLAADPKVIAAIQTAIDAANEQLSRVEQIKKFTIVQGDWLPGGDELTPTMKLKRKPIEQKYAAVINALYAPAAAGERTRRPPAQNEPPDRTGEPKGQTDA
jgi:long-chain acyl-CoA synthetase